jgi:hypothetical protein
VVGVDVPDFVGFFGGVEVWIGVRAEERDEGSSTTGIGRRVLVFIGDDEVPACCDTDLARVFRGVSGILPVVFCVCLYSVSREMIIQRYS